MFVSIYSMFTDSSSKEKELDVTPSAGVGEQRRGQQDSRASRPNRAAMDDARYVVTLKQGDGSKLVVICPVLHRPVPAPSLARSRCTGIPVLRKVQRRIEHLAAGARVVAADALARRPSSPVHAPAAVRRRASRMSFGKSESQAPLGSPERVTFKDVAGCRGSQGQRSKRSSRSSRIRRSSRASAVASQGPS